MALFFVVLISALSASFITELVGFLWDALFRSWGRLVRQIFTIPSAFFGCVILGVEPFSWTIVVATFASSFLSLAGLLWLSKATTTVASVVPNNRRR